MTYGVPSEHAPRVANKAAMVMADPDTRSHKYRSRLRSFLLVTACSFFVSPLGHQNDGDRFVANHDPMSIVGGHPPPNARRPRGR